MLAGQALPAPPEQAAQGVRHARVSTGIRGFRWGWGRDFPQPGKRFAMGLDRPTKKTNDFKPLRGRRAWHATCFLCANPVGKGSDPCTPAF